MPSQSILYKKSQIAHTYDVSGLINVSMSSDSELGQKLAPEYPWQFETIFGTVGTVKNLMDFISKPKYPFELLAKKTLSEKDLKRVPFKSIAIPNYWAVVAYGIYQRILSDASLMEAIRENTLEYGVFSSQGKRMFFGREIPVMLPNVKMGRYLAIIRYIDKFIKDGTFNDEAFMEKFIIECKDDESKDIFDSVPVVKKDK